MKRSEKAKELSYSLEVKHPHAAGIDIGSRSHWVAVGQDAEDIREFGVYSEDQFSMCKWLKEKGITHIAMECTGTYWQNLYSTLIGYGYDVILVNGKQTKHPKGQKTDIKDCQWIQKMHTLGILYGCFLPDKDTESIRTYSRHRLNLLNQNADVIRRIQKYLRLMNMRLDVVVSDTVGVTGRLIIQAFLGGETDGKKLASYRQPTCKKSEEEITKALQYNGKKEMVFTLKQEWSTYLHLQDQIKQTDDQIKELIKSIIDKDENKKQHVAVSPKQNKKKKKNKNGIKNADMRQLSYQHFEGVDLMAIEGVSDGLVMCLMSEIGPEGMKKFEVSKQFVSWMRLAPNNKISGGKVLSRHIPKGSSRLKIAFRNAANAIGLLKEGRLAEFFKKINYKKGRMAAISAVARKLAVIVWNMVVKGENYCPPKEELLITEKQKLKMVKNMKKRMEKFQITAEQLGITGGQLGVVTA